MRTNRSRKGLGAQQSHHTKRFAGHPSSHPWDPSGPSQACLPGASLSRSVSCICRAQKLSPGPQVYS